MAQQVFTSYTGLNTHHDAAAIDRSRNGKTIYIPAEHRGTPGFGAPDLSLRTLITVEEFASVRPQDQDDYTLTAGGNYISMF